MADNTTQKPPSHTAIPNNTNVNVRKDTDIENSEIISPPTESNDSCNASHQQNEDMNNDSQDCESTPQQSEPDSNVAHTMVESDANTPAFNEDKDDTKHVIDGKNNDTASENIPFADGDQTDSTDSQTKPTANLEDAQSLTDTQKGEDNGSVPAAADDARLQTELAAGSDNKPASTGDVSAPRDVTECAAGATSGSKQSESSESTYHIKWVYFKRKQVPIITQNENGPCPLLAIMNVLLLQNRIRLNLQADMISAGQLMTHLGDCVLQNVPGSDDVSTPSRLNFEQNMGDAMAVMYKLQTGLDVNVKFTGISDFEYTSECIIFDLLQIALYHGWLVDPQNESEADAVGKISYNQLVEKIISLKSSSDAEMVRQGLVAEQFLESSASQLTYHGLSELASRIKDDELAVLFRNNHFTTLYRHNDELFQLVTDQGFLNEGNVVWETLSNVEGDCHFVDSNFRTYTKPEPPPLQMEPSNVAPNSDEQIDQDYLVALSLQQEPPPGWSNQNAQLTDEELAKQLQEEEQRAALAEQTEAQRRQQGQARNPGGGTSQSRGQQRGSEHRERDREHKKSDCCIL